VQLTEAGRRIAQVELHREERGRAFVTQASSAALVESP
jgi:hypothetical protein